MCPPLNGRGVLAAATVSPSTVGESGAAAPTASEDESEAADTFDGDGVASAAFGPAPARSVFFGAPDLDCSRLMVSSWLRTRSQAVLIARRHTSAFTVEASL